MLVGDGIKNIEQLIFDNPRTHYMADYLLNLHEDKLVRVLGQGETFQVVEIGSHCRGSVFLDGNKHITLELAQEIDNLSKCIEGFYFGRYDIRVSDASALKEGRSFKVLEVNGVTSESTNMYDPKYSVLDAYRILFKQWRGAFEVGRQNIAKGKQKISVLGFFRHLYQVYG